MHGVPARLGLDPTPLVSYRTPCPRSILRAFFCASPAKSMREWFSFAIMVLLVFGPLLLDELSRVRRATARARSIVHGPISLAPDDDEQNLIRSQNAAPIRKTKEYVA